MKKNKVFMGMLVLSLGLCLGACKGSEKGTAAADTSAAAAETTTVAETEPETTKAPKEVDSYVCVVKDQNLDNRDITIDVAKEFEEKYGYEIKTVSNGFSLKSEDEDVPSITIDFNYANNAVEVLGRTADSFSPSRSPKFEEMEINGRKGWQMRGYYDEKLREYQCALQICDEDKYGNVYSAKVFILASSRMDFDMEEMVSSDDFKEMLASLRVE